MKPLKTFLLLLGIAIALCTCQPKPNGLITEQLYKEYRVQVLHLFYQHQFLAENKQFLKIRRTRIQIFCNLLYLLCVLLLT